VSLAAKIRRLIDLRRDPDGETYPISTIASEASRLYRERQILARREQLRAAGASALEIEHETDRIRQEKDVLNRSYLSELKDGKRTNPTYNVIEALSLFFQVSPAYFFVGPAATQETERAEKDVELVAETVKMLRHLTSATKSDDEDVSGDDEVAQLFGALARGGQQGDPKQVINVLRLAVAALPPTAKEPDE